jgi:hypothetical protein
MTLSAVSLADTCSPFTKHESAQGVIGNRRLICDVSNRHFSNISFLMVAGVQGVRDVQSGRSKASETDEKHQGSQSRVNF